MLPPAVSLDNSLVVEIDLTLPWRRDGCCVPSRSRTRDSPGGLCHAATATSAAGLGRGNLPSCRCISTPRCSVRPERPRRPALRRRPPGVPVGTAGSGGPDSASAPCSEVCIFRWPLTPRSVGRGAPAPAVPHHLRGPNGMARPPIRRRIRSPTPQPPPPGELPFCFRVHFPARPRQTTTVGGSVGAGRSHPPRSRRERPIRPRTVPPRSPAASVRARPVTHPVREAIRRTPLTRKTDTIIVWTLIGFYSHYGM